MTRLLPALAIAALAGANPMSANPKVDHAWACVQRLYPELSSGVTLAYAPPQPAGPDGTRNSWLSPTDPSTIYLNSARMQERDEARIAGYLAHELEHRRQILAETWVGKLVRLWDLKMRPYRERRTERAASAAGEYATRACASVAGT